MNLQMTHGRLPEGRQTRLLFGLCWLAYVTTYLGRLNYAACLVEISRTQVWDKGEAGLVATAFFTAYGLGQLVNGCIGDRLAPRYMVACGLGCSGIINFLFPMMFHPAAAALLWGINGFVQSMVWSPLIRLLSEWLPAEKRLNACVNMNGTVPVGTFLVYGMSSVLVFLGSWKWVFRVSGTLLIVMAAVFLVGIGRLDGQVQPVQESGPRLEQTGTEHIPFGKLALLSAIPLSFVGVLMQGMLKDGVTTWIPTFLEEQFHISSAGAILSTMVVPLINLGGVYLASWLNRRLFRNEALGASCFFGAGFVTLGLLALFPDRSALVSLLLLAAATTLMMGINTLIAGMMPSYYVHYGVCSTISGILNSGVYLGSALSSYLNGAIVELHGWHFIIRCWCVYAIVGTVVCTLSIKKWGKFRTK